MRWVAVFLGFVLNLMLFSGAAELARLNWWQAFALLSALNFVAILLHELGHAWAFKWIGGSVQKIVVMFAAYDARTGRLGWSRIAGQGDVGGYVAGSYPPGGMTRANCIRVYAAGPVANAATGLLALGAALLLSAPTPYPVLPSSGAVEMAVPETDATRENQERNPASLTLPSDADVERIAARYSEASRRHWWHQMAYAALMLFAVLSFGFAALNLIPYAGSDGQAILSTLKKERY
jgi:hypothetical protein